MATGEVAPHPTVEVEVSPGYKIIGGGALVNFNGAGSLLTASYPLTQRKWVAAAKDHRQPDPSSISAWAIAIFDPKDDWEVIYETRTSQAERRPQATVMLPEDFVLTGGGARVNWEGRGSMLTGSFPSDEMAWTAQAQDQGYECAASITAFAIGMRPSNRAVINGTRIFHAECAANSHPRAAIVLPSGYILTGGGARIEPTAEGNFLTGSFPSGTMSWDARGKDHLERSPSTVAAYVIGYPAAA